LEAVRITSIRTRRRDAAEEITHLAAMADGRAQWFTVAHIVEAIEDGKLFVADTGNRRIAIVLVALYLPNGIARRLRWDGADD